MRLFHPYEEVLGRKLKASDRVKVTVHPFRSLLLLATTEECEEPSLANGPYRVVQNLKGSEPVLEKLIPMELEQPWHRKLANLEPTQLPKDWVGFYEATMFAADNDSLEHRSIERSGPTEIPIVQRARDFFFNQKILKDRAVSLSALPSVPSLIRPTRGSILPASGTRATPTFFPWMNPWSARTSKSSCSA